MINLKYLFRKHILRKPELYRFVEPKNIPYSVAVLSHYYPVLSISDSFNKAHGQIKLIEFCGIANPYLRVGQSVVQNNEKGQTEVWIHLGLDYFKQILKA